MNSSSNSVTANKQETYVRARDSLFFAGMRRGEAKVNNKESLYNIRAKFAHKSMSRSASDISDRRLIKGSLATPTFSPSIDSPDIVLEPDGQSSSGRWSKTSSPLSGLKLDSIVNYVEEFSGLSSPRVSRADVENLALKVSSAATVQRSYRWNERKMSRSNVPLPPSAALFYMGHSPLVEVVESCSSLSRLNTYLKTKKEELKAGVAGRFLHAVVGPYVSDLGSVAATIIYAFYLNETMQSDQFCTVPIINLKREEINSRGELRWILEQCNIDQSSLVFIDEIDLSYYNLYGSLKLVLVNSDKLPSHQEDLHDALVEIFHCRKTEKMTKFVHIFSLLRQQDNAYPWVENTTIAQDVSCCTVVADRFAHTSPEALIIKGVSRLLLAGILLDTGNLTNPQSTERDKCMTTLLIHGAGRFGCHGLYQILRYKMYDVTELKVQDILQKYYRKWTKLGRYDSIRSRSMTTSNIGMSSIGVSVGQLLSHSTSSAQEITEFQRFEKLCLLLIISGYYDAKKVFKREFFIGAECSDAMKDILRFLNSRASELPLSEMHQPGLRDEMRIFQIDRVVSRSTIERLLEEFCRT